MRIGIEYYCDKNEDVFGNEIITGRGFNITMTPSKHDVCQIDEIVEHCDHEMIWQLNLYLEDHIDNIKISDLSDSDCEWNKNTGTGYMTYYLPIGEEYWDDITPTKDIILKRYKLWKSEYLADMR